MMCGLPSRTKVCSQFLIVLLTFPSPLDVPPVKGTNDDEEEVELPDPKEPLSALAFKIVTDPFVGTLTYIRVYQSFEIW